MLKNELTVAIRGIGTAENERCEVYPLSGIAELLEVPAKLRRLPVAAKLRLVDGYAAHGAGLLFFFSPA